MTKYFYIFTLFFMAVVLELYAGNFGIIFPLTAVLVFYVTITYGIYEAIVAGLVAGYILDVLYSRPQIVSPFIFLIVIFLALLWFYRGDSSSLLVHILPGAITAFIYIFSVLIAGALNSPFGWLAVKHNFPNLLFGIIASSMLPLLIVFLDSFAQYFELDLYSNAREKLVDRK